MPKPTFTFYGISIIQFVDKRATMPAPTLHEEKEVVNILLRTADGSATKAHKNKNICCNRQIDVKALSMKNST